MIVSRVNEKVKLINHVKNVLLIYDGLDYVASLIGNPMCMDHATKLRQRLNFAKFCVEIPVAFSTCKKFGHKAVSCTSNTKTVWVVKETPCDKRKEQTVNVPTEVTKVINVVENNTAAQDSDVISISPATKQPSKPIVQNVNPFQMIEQEEQEEELSTHAQINCQHQYHNDVRGGAFARGSFRGGSATKGGTSSRGGLTVSMGASNRGGSTVVALTTSYVAHAGDADIVSDFIIPANSSAVDGKFFTYTGMRGIFDVQAVADLIVTKASMAEFPALNGQSVSFAVLKYPPGTINPPHTHPRASELLFVLEGSLEVGLVDTTNEYFNQTLQEGDLFIFPKGLVHYQYNSNSKGAIAISAFGSANAGTVSIPRTVFSSGIDTETLAKAFKTDIATIQRIEAGLVPK
ncbi:hypothetical protein IFM89_030993 [Coptis chinensis]|uniref:Cupin type-1 domain-containing protein n=1 Tax=Coptis chinensis TaxID=261450 RepID=A0A835H6Z1_9MAGN|nr:hypothetical protein IFM89_030993 [Coptis chinensis]